METGCELIHLELKLHVQLRIKHSNCNIYHKNNSTHGIRAVSSSSNNVLSVYCDTLSHGETQGTTPGTWSTSLSGAGNVGFSLIN